MGRGAGAKRRGHDGSQTEGERRYEMLAESRDLMARIDAKLQDVSGPPALKGSEVYGQQLDTSAALNRSEDSRRELEALLKSVAEAVRPKDDDDVLEEPLELEATEQPFEDSKKAIAKAREELLEAARGPETIQGYDCDSCRECGQDERS